MSSHTTITIPMELGKQLRRIAEHHGLTITTYMSELIKAETKRAGIQAMEAPIVIRRLEDNPLPIRAIILGTLPVSSTVPAAHGLADTLEAMSVDGGPHLELNADIEPMLKIGRRGTGVTVEHFHGEDRTRLPPIKVAMSRDEAHQIVAALRMLTA